MKCWVLSVTSVQSLASDLPPARPGGRGTLHCMRGLSIAAWLAVGLLVTLPAADAATGGSLAPVGSPGVGDSPAAGGAPAPASSPGLSSDDAKGHAAGCLKAGNGYLRARIRGDFNLDIDWHNGEMECDGGARPDGSGIRVSFAGPVHSDGRRLRLVFGVGNAKEGRSGRELPTNLTVIFEGEQRLFATRGENRCTVDQLEQERLGALGGPRRSYRIVARGFCVSPASTLNGEGRILVSRFDFAGNATFEDEEP